MAEPAGWRLVDRDYKGVRVAFERHDGATVSTIHLDGFEWSIWARTPAFGQRVLNGGGVSLEWVLEEIGDERLCELAIAATQGARAEGLAEIRDRLTEALAQLNDDDSVESIERLETVLDDDWPWWQALHPATDLIEAGK